MIAAAREGFTSDSNVKRKNLGTVRILVADDFDLFRNLVTSILKEQTGYHIVGEAADGREAVRRAEELQPDLVVLDMGLPDVRGIEVARRIKICSPNSRILFLTTSNDPEWVFDRVHVASWGHVLKVDVVSELVKAAKAVLSGEWFVGPQLSD
jgi:DNA-binding NarL/FixJ family response regulator